MNDSKIMIDLIWQVAMALEAAETITQCASEEDVRTYITRPMWNAFCRATNIPENSKPTAWKRNSTHDPSLWFRNNRGGKRRDVEL